MNKFDLIMTQSEKGGSGKSTVKQAVIAGLLAGGARVLVVDADDGNSGYIRRAGVGSAIPLSWTTGTDAMDGWLAKHLGDHDTLAVDCGANIIASGAQVNEFLGELVLRAGASGGKVIALAVASTNAPGTGRLARQMRDAYGDYADVRLIQNDQDGSAAFSRSLATLGMPTATFPHIRPGVQAARLLTVAPLLDVLRAPPSGYETAMAIYAEVVASFMAEAAVRDLFSDEALNHVRALSEKAPGDLSRVVLELRHATNAAIAGNRALLIARRELRKAAADRSDLSSIGRAALKWLDADVAYLSLIR